MVTRTVPQSYPRIEDESNKTFGMLAVDQLVSHQKKFTDDEMAQMIRNSIRKANQKSSRVAANTLKWYVV